MFDKLGPYGCTGVLIATIDYEIVTTEARHAHFGFRDQYCGRADTSH